MRKKMLKNLPYIPHTDEELDKMLDSLGEEGIENLLREAFQKP